MNLVIIQEFLGWSSVINLSILILSGLMLIIFKDLVKSIHGKMFNLDEKELDKSYFRYLANYKILIFIFNIVPYFVLRFFV
jgi:hypothetical protein